MFVVAVHIPVAGLYSSALLKNVPFPLSPPAASTWPLGSSAMMKSSRPVVMLAVAVHAPVDGFLLVTESAP